MRSFIRSKRPVISRRRSEKPWFTSWRRDSSVRSVALARCSRTAVRVGTSEGSMLATAREGSPHGGPRQSLGSEYGHPFGGGQCGDSRAHAPGQPPLPTGIGRVPAHGDARGSQQARSFRSPATCKVPRPRNTTFLVTSRRVAVAIPGRPVPSLAGGAPSAETSPLPPAPRVGERDRLGARLRGLQVLRDPACSDGGPDGEMLASLPGSAVLELLAKTLAELASVAGAAARRVGQERQWVPVPALGPPRPAY